ncbi:hypothetical protein LguiB_018540 [Lonicera macranthoides]
MAHISDIKLIKTNTTLDLSQKAEKGVFCLMRKHTVFFSKRQKNSSLCAHRAAA